ncbi:MAG TPA: hypothetical protein VG755_23575 [Nannocystaceae bacterium]|nr:hypothetical protein [Nannocystaceae bacterium]
MNKPIKVSSGNFVGALFRTVGRDVADLFRQPFAAGGGIVGLGLVSALLLLGGTAMANASANDCDGLTTTLNNARSARDQVAGNIASLETDIASLQARLDGVETNLVNAPTKELEERKTDLKQQIAALEAKRPALTEELTAAQAHADEAEKTLSDAECPVEDDFEIDFTPGTLARLGVKIEEKDMPQKIIVQETRAEDEPTEETPQNTVTTDDQVKPSEEPPKDKPKDPAKEKPKFKDDKDKKLPTSKTPTTSNTPYKKDLPTVQQNQGDPFGDPEGWDDLTRDGDPWATSVMKALNNMPVGTYAAKGAKGTFKFQLYICKDGTIKDNGVLSKGGSMDQDGQSAVRLALEQLKIPKPPKKVADSMPSSCAKIKYTFEWSSGKVK